MSVDADDATTAASRRRGGTPGKKVPVKAIQLILFDLIANHFNNWSGVCIVHFDPPPLSLRLIFSPANKFAGQQGDVFS